VSVFGRNPWGGAHHTNAVADPEAARATVRELSDAGVDAIKVIYDGGQDDVWPRLDETVLAAIADEARAHSLPTMVHVHGVEELVTAVELGATRFVHMPYRGSIADAQAARLLREASIPIATTVGIRAPITDAAGGIGRTPGAGRVEFTPLRQMYLTQMLDNLRTLWDAGVIVAFGTDTASLRPAAAIAHEIRTLNEVLTAAEIITALTKNAAQFLGRSEDIGTLEPGKFADIVIIDGDPLTDISSLANVVLVIKAGKIVVDNR
jgi:imidazolonepropionase-like amidohydrolase